MGLAPSAVADAAGVMHCEGPLSPVTEPGCLDDWLTNLRGWKQLVCNVAGWSCDLAETSFAPLLA